MVAFFIKNTNLYLFLIVLVFTTQSFSQNTEEVKYTATHKGKVFFSWGGNRASYTKSNIRFKGENYDFTIKNALAKDKPKGWHIDYINPTRLTIPQTNFKLGYFVSDRYYVAFGLDHMKYVMNQNKFREVDGYIDLPSNDPASVFNGDFNDDTIFVSEHLVRFEHTDGLNYLYAEFGRFDDLSGFFGIKNTDKFQVNLTEGIGVGGLYPKTNATLLGRKKHDQFHVSGFGVSLNLGLNVTFFKHFFIQLDARGGYINMPNIRTTNSAADVAKQQFFFFERTVSFGGIFRLK